MKTNNWRENLSNLKCINGAMYVGAVETPCSGRETGECCIYEQTFEEAISELENFVQSLLDEKDKEKQEALDKQKEEIIKVIEESALPTVRFVELDSKISSTNFFKQQQEEMDNRLIIVREIINKIKEM